MVELVVGDDRYSRPKGLLEVMQDPDMGALERAIVVVAAYKSDEIVHPDFARQAAERLREVSSGYSDEEKGLFGAEVEDILSLLDFIAAGDDSLSIHSD